MIEKRIQAPHKMKCEHCDVGFAKLVKSDELINGKKCCVYYCEHCKNYQLYNQVEHQPKRFTATTSRGLYCWDNVTGKRYDAVDDFFEMMDLLNDFNDENKSLKASATMYRKLFLELQKQLKGVRKASDLDSKDFEDLIELAKGNVFDDEIGWIHLPVKELEE